MIQIIWTTCAESDDAGASLGWYWMDMDGHCICVCEVCVCYQSCYNMCEFAMFFKDSGCAILLSEARSRNLRKIVSLILQLQFIPRAEQRRGAGLTQNE